jgi:hypothetical protein
MPPSPLPAPSHPRCPAGRQRRAIGAAGLAGGCEHAGEVQRLRHIRTPAGLRGPAGWVAARVRRGTGSWLLAAGAADGGRGLPACGHVGMVCVAAGYSKQAGGELPLGRAVRLWPAGEAFDYVGSRRLLYEMTAVNNSVYTRGLRLDLIDQVRPAGLGLCCECRLQPASQLDGAPPVASSPLPRMPAPTVCCSAPRLVLRPKPALYAVLCCAGPTWPPSLARWWRSARWAPPSTPPPTPPASSCTRSEGAPSETPRSCCPRRSPRVPRRRRW